MRISLCRRPGRPSSHPADTTPCTASSSAAGTITATARRASTSQSKVRARSVLRLRGAITDGDAPAAQSRTTRPCPRFTTFPPPTRSQSSASCGRSPSSLGTACQRRWKARTGSISWAVLMMAVRPLPLSYRSLCLTLAGSIRRLHAEYVCARDPVGQDGARTRRRVYSPQRAQRAHCGSDIQDEGLFLRHIQRDPRPRAPRQHRRRRGERKVELGDGVQEQQGARRRRSRAAGN